MKYYIVVTILLLFNSCNKRNIQELNIFMWADTIPKQIYDLFEKETGITIIENAISSNEEIYAKVKSSSEGYDIVTPSLDYASIMIKEGLIAQLNTNQIPNITNIDPNILKHILTIDTNHQYIMPFIFGPTVIAYDKTKIPSPIIGFEVFSDEKYKGRMSLLNDMREVLGSALLYLGYTEETTNQDALNKAKILLNQWKSNILRFDADAYHLSYANGEVDIVHGYPDSILQALTKTQISNTAFIIPSKGGIMWLDSFLVLNSSSNKEAAMKFINFIHRPEIYAQIMDYIHGLSLNIPARKLMTIKAPISYDALSNTTMLKDIGQENLQIHSRLWENIQAQ